MKERHEILRCVLEGGIIVVIRAPDVERGYNLAEAARRGGYYHH